MSKNCLSPEKSRFRKVKKDRPPRDGANAVVDGAFAGSFPELPSPCPPPGSADFNFFRVQKNLELEKFKKTDRGRPRDGANAVADGAFACSFPDGVTFSLGRTRRTLTFSKSRKILI